MYRDNTYLYKKDMETDKSIKFRIKTYRISKLMLTLFVHVSSMLSIFYLYPASQIIFVVGIWAVVVLLFLLLKEQLSFPFLFFLIVAFGTFSMYVLMAHPETNQILQIARHIVVLSASVSIWMLVYLLYNFSSSYEALRKEIDSLKKFEPIDRVLTKNEFFYRLNQIVANINRNKVSSTLLIVRLDKDESYKERINVEKTGEALVSTVRDNFDIVGLVDELTFAVTLQDCPTEKVEIVVSRFEKEYETLTGSSEQQFSIYHKDMVKLEDCEFLNEFNTTYLPKGVKKYA